VKVTTATLPNGDRLLHLRRSVVGRVAGLIGVDDARPDRVNDTTPLLSEQPCSSSPA